MIPLKDDVPARSVPFVTVLLIGFNVLVYLYQVSLGLDPESRAVDAFVAEFGVVPCRLSGACPAPLAFPSPVATVLTSMFVHGGFLHIAGNMLYLWIFGDNVEDRLGHGRFLLFYLVSGAAAALGQTAVDPASRIPMIGASGAVSGVLGAYLLLFPYATILTLVTFGFFIRFIRVPAMIVLGFWIVLQLINGYVTHSARVAGHPDVGGVAWFAHIGGFLAGMVLLILLKPRARARL